MSDEKTRLSYMEGIISVIINTVLFALKFWAGTLSGSISVIADAWHTLSDSLTSIIVIIGAKTTQKPADKEHPFGHGRAELIASIIIGVLLCVVGVNFFTESLKKFYSKEITVFSKLTLYVTASSVIVKEAIAQFSFWAYRKTGSNALKADGWHHRSDAITSFLIVIGILFSANFWWVDALLGIIVSVLLALTAVGIIRDGAAPLLGESPDKNLMAGIKKIVFDTTGEESDTHHFHLHKYGNHTELTFHIRLPGKKTVQEGHGTATKIEKEIKEQLNIDATIHVEPKKSGK